MLIDVRTSYCCHAQREVTRVRIAQSMKGDLDSQQEAYLRHLVEEKVCHFSALR